MAHKKAGGAAKKNKDSVSKRLGVKLFGGELCRAGNIIIRQKGNKYFPGKNVGQGNDFTIYALVDGIVRFKEKKLLKYNKRMVKNRIVSVEAPAKK